MAEKVRVESEIDFLSEVENGEVVTQTTLAKRISVSAGMMNALLRRAMTKGFVKAKAAPYKRYAYYLTPKGFREKSRLVAEYLESSLDFFRQARSEYVEQFERAKACGKQEFYLAGGGELTDIAHIVARENDVELMGIYDPETNVSQKFGIPIVRSLDGLAANQAVIIVESRAPQEVFDALCKTVDPKSVFAPDLLRITRESLDFTPPDVAPKQGAK